MRPALEVADIVRAHGDEFRQAHATPLSTRQKRVLRSIELCRTAVNLDTGRHSTEMTFRFLDATNLKSEQDAHLIRLVLKIRDDDHFEKTEVYTERGVEDITVYQFMRVR